MKFTLLVHDSVFAEINDATLYYEDKQIGLGKKLYEDFEDSLMQIEERPLSFQKTKNNYRHTLLDKFPYLILFRVYENKILVYKFIHAKQHPAKHHKKK